MAGTSAAGDCEISPPASLLERECRSVSCMLSQFLPLSIVETRQGNPSVSADDTGLTQLAYIVGVETELRAEDRVAILS